MNKILEKIEKEIIEDLNLLGFDLEYTEYVKELDNYILRIVIEKLDKSNMDTADCEIVSKKIEDKVDNLMKAEYMLEVSSPGFERVLKTEKLWKKYIGETVLVKLFKKTNILTDVALKEFEAELVEYTDEGKITFRKMFDKLDLKFTISKDEIASAHTVFDYDKMFRESK